MTTVATTSWPTLTRPSTPPHCMNTDSWSTSLVTRETSEPRRSPCWCSTERSCTCRKARTRRPASAVSVVRKSRTFIRKTATAVITTTSAQASDQPGDQAQVGVAAGRARGR